MGRRQYTLTICTYQRSPLFGDADTVSLVLAQFLRVAIDQQFQVLAYCFMPNHLHAVVTALSDRADLQRFVRLAKQRTGFCFVRAVGHRLWQESYFERTVRHDDDVAGHIRYILMNPVRAGLAAAPAEYPHWGSQVYSREEVLTFIGARRRV